MFLYNDMLIANNTDVCILIEPHFNTKRADIFERMMSDIYECIIANRMITKARDTGSGGVVILVRQNIGKIKQLPAHKNNCRHQNNTGTLYLLNKL